MQSDNSTPRPIPHAERLDQGALGREARLLRAMFEQYCRKHHGSDSLCAECQKLLRYALTRLACCPFGNQKPTCFKCKVHCYRGEEKDKVRAVMRETGPKMLWIHPLLTVEHLLKNLKEAPDRPRNPNVKKQQKNKEAALASQSKHRD